MTADDFDTWELCSGCGRYVPPSRYPHCERKPLKTSDIIGMSNIRTPEMLYLYNLALAIESQEKTINITADHLKQAGFTVETDGAKAFIADIESAHRHITEHGNDWEKDAGNFTWFVARRAVGEHRTFMEVATLIHELGLEETPANEEFYCASVKSVAQETLYQLTVELVQIATGWVATPYS